MQPVHRWRPDDTSGPDRPTDAEVNVYGALARVPEHRGMVPAARRGHPAGGTYGDAGPTAVTSRVRPGTSAGHSWQTVTLLSAAHCRAVVSRACRSIRR